MRRALAAAGLALVACEREAPPGVFHRPYVLAPEVPDAAGVDATTPGLPRCALRAGAPEDLALGADIGVPRLAWNGSHFAVVWPETIDEEDAIRFVRVSARGQRMGVPLRVSERRFQARSPSLTWNGDSWSVVFAGGIRATGDLYQARVDARGSAVGRPWRMTRGDRHDLEPVFVSTGRGFALAWTSVEPDGRWSLYGEVLNRWDAPIAPPTQLLNTSVRLLAPQLLYTGQAWAVTAITARREVFAVDMARMEPTGLLRGGVTRISNERIGGIDTTQRYAVAWDGHAFAVVWSELRDGTPQLFFRKVTTRGNPLEPTLALRVDEDQAENPSLAALEDGAFVLAEQVVREGFPRIRVRVIGADLTLNDEGVELRGVDGAAQNPTVVWNGETLGLVTRSERGVAFHRVILGPCAARPAPATRPPPPPGPAPGPR